MILKENTSIKICPKCGGRGFNIIENNRTTKRRKTFYLNGEHHIHDNGIQSQKVECLRCKCIFIQTSKRKCIYCNFNERFKSIIIIIKKGKKL